MLLLRCHGAYALNSFIEEGDDGGFESCQGICTHQEASELLQSLVYAQNRFVVTFREQAYNLTARELPGGL